MFASNDIKTAAFSAGFDICGVARACELKTESGFFHEWLERGYDGGLGYMRRNAEKRFSPGMLLENARSIIVCGVSYKNDTGGGYPAGYLEPKIASYARSADYHDTIRGMLGALSETLRKKYGSFRFRAFTDSAPVSEKCWAVEAGLGWQGRNSLIISPVLGSFFLIGELITDVEVDLYDDPYEGPGCGSCDLCIRRCPNGAITNNKCVDASRCIARITIEKHKAWCTETEGLRSSPPGTTLNGWVFGCDECQNICPHNVAAPLYINRAFEPLYDPREFDKDYWLSLSESEFNFRFGSTPLLRCGLAGIKNNIEAGLY